MSTVYDGEAHVVPAPIVQDAGVTESPTPLVLVDTAITALEDRRKTINEEILRLTELQKELAELVKRITALQEARKAFEAPVVVSGAAGG